jgi:hypothetical protein
MDCEMQKAEGMDEQAILKPFGESSIATWHSGLCQTESRQRF